MNLRKWFLKTFTGPEFIVPSVVGRDDQGRPTALLVHTHPWADEHDVLAAVQRETPSYQMLRVERQEPQWWRALVCYRAGYSGPVA